MKKVQWDEINDEQMNALLLELADTNFYQAMTRFIAVRLGIADDGLRSIDSFKNPTEMARMQGLRTGLQDLSLYMDDLVEASTKEDKK